MRGRTNGKKLRQTFERAEKDREQVIIHRQRERKPRGD
jgi:hypothetical protein